MSDNVFIDSSLWVDYFKRSASSIDKTIKELLEVDVIYTNGVVISELIAGSRRDESTIICCIDYLNICEMNYDFFVRSGQMIRKLNLKGKTCPLTDVYIACHCLEYNLKLLAHDKHFDMISEFYPLQYVQMSSVRL
jgi:predicted nucleic acid-binding protein